jgi:hypothetical protein
MSFMAATRTNVRSRVKARPKARRTPRVPQVRTLTRAQGRALFDREARRCCGMNGEEFLRKWDANEFPDPDTIRIMHVAMLIPFAR